MTIFNYFFIVFSDNSCNNYPKDLKWNLFFYYFIDFIGFFFFFFLFNFYNLKPEELNNLLDVYFKEYFSNFNDFLLIDHIWFREYFLKSELIFF